MTLSPPQTRMSKSSLFSLIFGILGCIPFVTGLLAMLLGLIGFVKAGKPGVTGRWMAVIGGLLGLISVGIWSVLLIVFGSFAGIVALAVGITMAPRIATHDFIRDLSLNNQVAIHDHSKGLSDAELKEIGDVVRAQGTFIDTTFGSSNINNDEAEVDGTAKFSSGEKQVYVHLNKEGETWKVDGFSIK